MSSGSELSVVTKEGLLVIFLLRFFFLARFFLSTMSSGFGVASKTFVSATASAATSVAAA